METNRPIVICFASCVYVLQNEYISIVSESLGRWSVGKWPVVGWLEGR